MLSFVSYLLLALALLLCVPVAVLLLEVVAAVALARAPSGARGQRNSDARVAVLVPAHDESRGLLPTIADIKAQLRPSDRLLVVADNCSDDTAAVAAAAGAEVVERHDLAKIGKGYALDWGLRHLGNDPPETVIVIDADCRLVEGTIDRLASACAITGRPVQALDLMVAPAASAINHQVAEFAWRVKNWVRPRGLQALGLPCQMMGTGMAFPWDAIRTINIASGGIVEDLRLGLDLALAGKPPLFCPTAVVTSQFPTSIDGIDSQRQRWEHGHIATIVTAAPRYVYLAATSGNLALLALALDLAVPPLSLLVLLVVGIFIAAGLAAIFGLACAALIVSAANLIAFAVAVALSWLGFGRDILPLSAAWSIGSYALKKLGLYFRLLTRGPISRWVRTDRKNSN